jgi:hypothetical protein
MPFALFFRCNILTQVKLTQPPMKRKILSSSREELIIMSADLGDRLKKRNEELTLARQRLSKAKLKIRRLEEIVSYQRERIIELHS